MKAGLWRTLGAVLFGFCGLSCLIGFIDPYLIQVPLTLVTGWVPFLLRVIPEVTPNPGALVEAGLVVAALGAGLHFFLRWLWRHLHAQEAEARAWPARWSASLLALLVLLFLATMATVGIGHQVGWLASGRTPIRQTLFRGPFYATRAAEVCRRALELSREGGVPDTQVGSRLLADPYVRDMAEGLHVVPLRKPEAPVRFLVFSRDPLVRAEEGLLRCEGAVSGYQEETYRAEALPKLLAGEEAQADGRTY